MTKFSNELLVWQSRENFLECLDLATDSDGNNPYDPNGIVTQLVSRGEPMARVLEALLRYEDFYRMKNLANKGQISDTDKGREFKVILDSLESIVDIQPACNWRDAAITKISKYDSDGVVSKSINQGADSKSVLTALGQSKAWLDALQDYETSGDVELPRQFQIERWQEFRLVLQSINDIDEIELDEADYLREFFEPVEIHIDDSIVIWNPDAEFLTPHSGSNSGVISNAIEDFIAFHALQEGAFGVTPTGPSLPATLKNLWTVVWVANQIFGDSKIELVGNDFPNLAELYGDDDETVVY